MISSATFSHPWYVRDRLGSVYGNNTHAYTGDGHVLCGGEGNSIADSIEMIRFDGGYFDADLVPHYYIADYLDSNIAVVDADGDLVQTATYYPYGEPHRNPLIRRGIEVSTSPPADAATAAESRTANLTQNEMRTANPYLYGDKEWMYQDGLREYVYGARMHVSSLPRFTSIDPLAEKHPEQTPYLFCAANPITYVDPMGMEVFYKLKGKVIYETEENKDIIYIVLTSGKKGSDQANTAKDNKEYISLPNLDLMKKIEEIKSDTEKIGKEHGFAVGESGTIGSITQGTENSVEIESVVVNDDGTLEKAAFNVHTHPLRNSNDPTPNDGASEGDIMSYSGTKPSIVLGYDAEPIYINKNTSIPSGYSHTPFLIFYNQNGQIGEKANYKSFKKVVEKLWKK